MADGGVISGISAVNEKMTELLGIRKEQFTQIAMIPQGDFLKRYVGNEGARCDFP